MISTIQESVGVAAPYYNMAFTLIIILLFIRLFTLKNSKIFFTPWKLIALALLFYIIEEIITILYFAQIVIIPRITNALLELIIVTIFLYAILLQKDYLKKTMPGSRAKVTSRRKKATAKKKTIQKKTAKKNSRKRPKR